jgi:hypothetical protein
MICPYCQLDRSIGHDEGCILALDVAAFSTDEIATLNVLRRRERDPWDAAPLQYANGTPIPWLTALNLDPARFGDSKQQ